MPLIPQLALMGNVPQVQMPDFTKTALLAQQIQESRGQEQLRMLQLSEILRQREQEQAAQAYLSQMLAGGQPGVTQAQRVPQAEPGTYVTPPTAYSQLTPGTQAPPGTTYTRAPAAMQPAMPGPTATATPGQAPPSALGLLRFGKSGRDLYTTYQNAMAGDAEARKDLMDEGLKRLDFVEQLIGVPTDQASYDTVLAQIKEVAPGLAGSFPPLFDRARLDAIQQQMQRAKQRAKGVQYGLQPLWGTDPSGRRVPMQATNQGQIQPSAVPEGYTVEEPTKFLDLKTGFQGVSPAGGQAVGAFIPKNVQEAAKQEKTGEKLGETEGQRPELARVTRQGLDQLQQKQRLVTEDIDRIFDLMKTATLPTTGFWGNILSGVPGTAAGDISKLVGTIGANMGIEELQDIRSASKTGGALGNVTEYENKMLQRLRGDITQSQSKEQLVRNLTRLRDFIAEAQQKREKAYQEDLAPYRQSPQAPPAASPRPAAVPTLEEIDAELARRQRGQRGQ